MMNVIVATKLIFHFLSSSLAISSVAFLGGTILLLSSVLYNTIRICLSVSFTISYIPHEAS